MSANKSNILFNARYFKETVPKGRKNFRKNETITTAFGAGFKFDFQIAHIYMLIFTLTGALALFLPSYKKKQWI
jgi:hypothetical protein